MTGKFLIACGLVLAVGLVSGTSSEALAATLAVPGDHPTIAAAFEAARTGDRIELAPGTYHEANLSMPNGVALVGRTGDPRDVVIDGLGNGRILLLESLDQSTLVAGITFRNGYASGRTSYERSGGAIFFSNSTARLNNCVFLDNASEGHGGAIRCINASPLITGCVFEGNRADSGGGGAIDCGFGSDPLVRGCTFDGNTAAWGGALSCRGYSSPTVYASVFHGNEAVGGKAYGGAVFADIGSTPVFDHVTAWDNAARYGGAFACLGEARTDLENCTITGNTAAVLGGGLFAYESSPNVTASIIAFQDGTGVSAEGGAQPLITCSNVYGNSQGDWIGFLATQLSTGDNLNADPLFCGTGTGGAAFTLAAGSPSGGETACGTMGAWPVGCTPAVPTVATFAADWSGQSARIEWEAHLYDRTVAFRLTGERADAPGATWDVPVTDLGGGFYEAVDAEARTGGAFVYRLYMDAGDGWELVDQAALDVVPGYSGIRDLVAYPNPFNPQTTISFRLGSPQRARVSVYTPDGRRVAVLADRDFGIGPQTVPWAGQADDGRRVGSGVYIVLVEGAVEKLTRKITLLK